MTVLSILTYPDARLQRKAEAVQVFDDELQKFIGDLTETMYAGPGASVLLPLRWIAISVLSLSMCGPNWGRIAMA